MPTTPKTDTKAIPGPDQAARRLRRKTRELGRLWKKGEIALKILGIICAA